MVWMDCGSVQMTFRVETKGGQMYKYTYVYFEKVVLFLLRFVNPKSDSSVNASWCNVYTAIL